MKKNILKCEYEEGGGNTSIERKNPDGSNVKKSKSYSWHKGTIEGIIQALGVSGIIAIMIIGTSCFISIAQLINKQNIELPKYLYEFSLLILGYYFGKNVSNKEASVKDQQKKMGFNLFGFNSPRLASL